MYSNPVIVQVTKTPTIDTAQYDAADVIGTLLQFTNAFGQGHCGEIINCVVADEGGEAKDLEIVFFHGNPSSSTFTDQAAVTVADADLGKIAGSMLINVHTAYSASGHTQATATQVPIGVVSDSTTLYAVLICRETVTFDAADALTIAVTLRQY